MNETTPLLSVNDLSIHYPVVGRGVVKAVDGVSFHLRAGETLALVGESGCGKTTVGRALIGLTPMHAGSVLFQGKELNGLRASEWKSVRKSIAMAFQDPLASLDPRWKLGSLIAEPLLIHHLGSKTQIRERVKHLLELVGLDPSLENRYPHELSGGQRARIAFARALSTDPALIIADEPTAALDISIRAQILNLIKDLQAQLGTAYLFISHDLSTVRYLANRVAVMYAGKIVETSPTEPLFCQPRHPYTRALLSSVPPPRATGVLPPVLSGEVPDPFSLPSGCRFRTRCPLAQTICAEKEPPLREIDPAHFSACHFAEKVS